MILLCVSSRSFVTQKERSDLSKQRATSRKNSRHHLCVCVMCGVPFKCARPDAATDDNACRSALRRWRAIYGAAPVNPPGKGCIRPPYWNRAAFFRAYVNLTEYKRLKGKLPEGV